ncbi:TetR/AcrR family transcriptional regulator [Pseudonocardia asaccharolytica]|uniref:TetR family transcriptional regulator n=1 Tax=Pseudonocardia asaccharolytica DSM 44247 = NBRC 16224 TaxID=1123024 RepID=A0A511D1Q1_9PSEU|nr:TetR/AcrR family transcriptional regulator [Pseudonocardia asaccharolytica]GEL16828.1 TetR family transcriptional regulator [Pseudonocardia asaccharolytica DSM 44247 = NBRC 16224]
MTATQHREESQSRRNGARRAELIALASRLFRERGYHGVGMRAIAEAADMQAASLYHHFRSKEELLLEAIFVVDRDMVVDQMPILDGPGSYRERLARLVRAHVMHIGVNRDAWWVAGRELRALSPEKLDTVQVYRRAYQHRIAQHLADGARAGEFRCDDPRLTTLAVLDMINGPNEWFDPAGRLSIDQIADHYAELVVRQLTP